MDNIPKALKKKIYLLGNTNTGKTSLYNALTGSNNKVANYHGATTKLSRCKLKRYHELILYDLPGTYSIVGNSKDENLTVQTLKNAENNSCSIFVLDGVNLKHHLLNLQTFLSNFDNLNQHIIIAVNMIDEVRQNNIKINFKKIEDLLNVPVIAISTKKKIDIDILEKRLIQNILKPATNLYRLSKKIQNLTFNDLIKQKTTLNVKRMYMLDTYLISPFWGTLFFIFTMSVLFQAIFNGAAPFMNLIENIFIFLSVQTSSFFENIYIKSFIEDAFYGGLGSFLVFTPQIFFLIFIIKSLEETGYLARASIICHKFLMFFGLSGESFIPILTSHACAIPGIYAARHIRSTKIRVLTILTLPLTLCSARLPVYALLITLLIPNNIFLGGLIGTRGFMLFILYIFGVSLTLFVSLILNKATFKPLKKPFLALELPRYQIPSLRVCIHDAAITTYHFIKDAGFIIFSTNCFIWVLATFPNGPENLNTSYLSKIGTAILPLSRPLGLDWPETIALLTSFLARETFVSTLGTLYGSASDDISALSQLILENTKHYSPASTLSLIVFFAIALQCISTLAVLRKELPNKNSVYALFFGYLVFAYTASFITYKIALLF